MPAKSMYSYSETLYKLLDEFKPQTAFEWGPGVSTQIISLYPSVEKLVSVENEIIFYDLLENLNFNNLVLRYCPDMGEYVDALGEQFYDIIFIDGRTRTKCLHKANGHSDIVILHDAAREEYREAIKSYKYQVWSDSGNTVVLTNDEKTNERILSILSGSLVEPKLEKVLIDEEACSKGVVL